MKACVFLSVLAGLSLLLFACDDFSWHGVDVDGDADLTENEIDVDEDRLENADSAENDKDSTVDRDSELDVLMESDMESETADSSEHDPENSDEVEDGDQSETDLDNESAELEDSEMEIETDRDWSPEFACGGGVCSDLSTGFKWQENGSVGKMNHNSAVNYCINLESDGGGWRLPNISELRTLVRNCAAIETDGSCGVLDVCPPCGVDSGERCLTATLCQGLSCSPSSCADNGGPSGCYRSPEIGGVCSWFWSASVESLNTNVFVVDFMKGEVNSYLKTNSNGYVRCVK